MIIGLVSQGYDCFQIHPYLILEPPTHTVQLNKVLSIQIAPMPRVNLSSASSICCTVVRRHCDNAYVALY